MDGDERGRAGCVDVEAWARQVQLECRKGRGVGIEDHAVAVFERSCCPCRGVRVLVCVVSDTYKRSDVGALWLSGFNRSICESFLGNSKQNPFLGSC